MTGRVAGKVCIVTGATGIASAAARRLCAEGASVFTISRDADECAALTAALEGDGYTHAWAAADLTDDAATASAFSAAIDRFGRLDGLFAVAGGSGRSLGDGPLDEIPLAGWRATIDLNLTTTFLSMREAVKHMRARPADERGGAIVVTTSVLAEHPSPELFATHAYAAAKGAQRSLVRATAARYAPDGIRINAIAPAVVATPMSRRAQIDEAITTYVTAKQPLVGGFLDPEDIASAALFLLSDESRAVTGQVLAVDGGWGVTDARA